MARFDTLGARALDVHTLASLIAGTLGVELELRDNDDLGEYFEWRSAVGEEELVVCTNEPNDEGDRPEPAFPEYRTVVHHEFVADETARLLRGVPGLDLLDSERDDDGRP